MASCLATAQLCSPPLAPSEDFTKNGRISFFTSTPRSIRGCCQGILFQNDSNFPTFLFLFILFCTGPFFGFQLFYYKVDVGLWLLLLPPNNSTEVFRDFKSNFWVARWVGGLRWNSTFQIKSFFFNGCPWWVLISFVLAKNTNCVMHPLGWRMIFPGARHGCVQCLWRNWIM